MSDDLDALLAAAVDDFRRSLGARVARLDALAAAGEGGSLRDEAHRLAGAAGCYGFTAVGDAARAVEDHGAGALPALHAALRGLDGAA